ncbi:TetR family transcriptional regulator [Rhodococcus sp. T2V]|uniref:TetR family transcriptional regulator n=1 Tax=Rhodococcus sp. T2V TaxID=3034164 RepID=UPI0023E16867|nr:TetR family transcriptional regulator [Rhodococcus sp. T2V]MDF3306533.1 TetR family transcriptional regulator [Rhodococcus sp. T2V]
MSTAEEPLTAGRDGLLSLLRHGQLPSRGAKAPQRERYQRIVAAAMELASEGGYDAVQMRAIADRAGVALGTVYRYFPSKNHMLVMGLLMVFEGMRSRFENVTIPGDTPSERILFVLRKNTEVLEKDRPRYEALVRAFMFADASASAELDAFGALMTEMFAKTIGVEKISDDQLNAIRVIGDVWMSSLVSWVAGRISVDDVMAHLGLAVRLVFRRLGG